MSDIGNLREFIIDKLIFNKFHEFEGFEEFSAEDLKELRFLATMALVSRLCSDHASVMHSILDKS
jgi:hypothetical protein